MKRKIQLALAMCLIMASIACTHNVQAPVQGSVNQFDSDTYLTLVTAKAAIDQAKVELANGTFTGKVAAAVKAAVNGAVTAYNVATTTYQAYHAAALAGTSTPSQQAAVGVAVANMNSSVANITVAKGAN